ncbi:MAG: TolC family protein, partial [Gemmatimonadales bacterium]
MIRMTLLAMATLAAAATSVAAQESIVALTLADALDLARRQSPALRRAQADMRTASADVRASYGAFLPSLTGTLTFQGSANTTVTGTDDFGRPIDLPEARTFRRSSASQSIGTSVTLFDGFQNLNNLHASQNRAAATRHGVEAEWVRVAAEVSRRFYDAIRTQRLIRVEEQLLQSAEEQLEATTRLFRVGSASQVDVLGAQVDVARQELEVERARGEARKSLLTLKQQIGIDEDIVFSVQGGFPEPIDPSSLNVDELVAEAIRFNPGVSRSRAVEAAARNSLGAAHGRRLPTISGGASFSRNSNLPDYDALFQFDPRDRVWAFNLQIQLPIFNGFGTEQLIAQARTQRTQAEENVRE